MDALEIELKEDSQEKLAQAVGKPTKFFLFALEFNKVILKINEIIISLLFNIRGTNHILVILDGTPEQNGVKFRAALTLGLDNVMCLGGTIDYLPDFTNKVIGSIDDTNPLIVRDDYNQSFIVYNDYKNMVFNRNIKVTGVFLGSDRKSVV